MTRGISKPVLWLLWWLCRGACQHIHTRAGNRASTRRTWLIHTVIYCDIKMSRGASFAILGAITLPVLPSRQVKHSVAQFVLCVSMLNVIAELFSEAKWDGDTLFVSLRHIRWWFLTWRDKDKWKSDSSVVLMLYRNDDNMSMPFQYMVFQVLWAWLNLLEIHF